MYLQEFTLLYSDSEFTIVDESILYLNEFFKSQQTLLYKSKLNKLLKKENKKTPKMQINQLEFLGLHELVQSQGEIILLWLLNVFQSQSIQQSEMNKLIIFFEEWLNRILDYRNKINIERNTLQDKLPKILKNFFAFCLNFLEFYKEIISLWKSQINELDTMQTNIRQVNINQQSQFLYLDEFFKLGYELIEKITEKITVILESKMNQVITMEMNKSQIKQLQKLQLQMEMNELLIDQLYIFEEVQMEIQIFPLYIKALLTNKITKIVRDMLFPKIIKLTNTNKNIKEFIDKNEANINFLFENTNDILPERILKFIINTEIDLDDHYNVENNNDFNIIVSILYINEQKDKIIKFELGDLKVFINKIIQNIINKDLLVNILITLNTLILSNKYNYLSIMLLVKEFKKLTNANDNKYIKNLLYIIKQIKLIPNIEKTIYYYCVKNTEKHLIKILQIDDIDDNIYNSHIKIIDKFIQQIEIIIKNDSLKEDSKTAEEILKLKYIYLENPEMKSKINNFLLRENDNIQELKKFILELENIYKDVNLEEDQKIQIKNSLFFQGKLLYNCKNQTIIEND